MLTHIKTPRVLISGVYEPDRVPYDHGRGDSGVAVYHHMIIQITPEVEENLPAYAREKVAPYSWYGVPEGTRGLKLSSGKSRPVVFGMPPDVMLQAQAMNIEPDQLLRNRQAVVCVTMGEKKGRDGGTWPILRAVLIDRPILPISYDGYTAEMASHWEFRS